VIEIRKLEKVYHLGDNEVRALDGVSLSIAKGEFVAIMGASGSGKSTMLQILGLLDNPDSGSYKLLGTEVSGLSEDELAVLRSRTIGFVFQQFNLLSRTSALDNVRLPRLYSREPEPAGLSEKLLKDVGLGGRTDHTPAQLSGGQQQRVAIARALMNNPSLIFADEPTGNLDSKSSEEILGLLDNLNRSGITIIMVTHEADIAKHAKRVIVMKDGKIVTDRKNPAKASRPSAKMAVSKAGAGAKPLKNRTRLGELGIYAMQAMRALLANKVRSALSVLGILIGVLSVIVVLAVGAGAENAMKAQMASLGSNLLILFPGSSNRGGVSQGSGSSIRLHLDDAEALAKKVKEVARVTTEINGRVQAVAYGKNWNTSLLGTGIEYPAMRAAKPALGRFFTMEEFSARARVVVLGVTVAKNLFGEQNPLGKSVKLNRVSFTIIGILPAKGSSGWRDEDDKVIVPTTTAMYRLLGRDWIDDVSLEVRSSELIDQAQDSIKAVMRERIHLSPEKDDPFQIFNLADIQAQVQGLTKTLTLTFSIIAAISLLVGGIGIMNIMLVSVTERTREIGLRKALGARRMDVLFQFLVESVVVSLSGGLAGVLLGSLAVTAVVFFLNWSTQITAGSILLAISFSAAVGILFGLWPAWKASRLHPIQALRYE
jgi:macrolide transport system ATP-binding/permease protein